MGFTSVSISLPRRIAAAALLLYALHDSTPLSFTATLASTPRPTPTTAASPTAAAVPRALLALESPNVVVREDRLAAGEAVAQMPDNPGLIVRAPAAAPPGEHSPGLMPLVLGIAPRSTAEDTPLVMSRAMGNAITMRDPNGSGHLLTMSLVVRHGTLSLAAVSGLQFTEGQPLGSSVMTFSGTTETINVALDGLTFVPQRHYVGDAGLCLDASYALPRMDAPNWCADEVDGYAADQAGGTRLAVRIPIVVVSANHPPTISDVADRNVPLGTVPPAIAFTVEDVDAVDVSSSELTLRVDSSNDVVVPRASLVITGRGAERQLTLRGPVTVAGTATITIAVSDQTSTTIRRFDVQVTCQPSVTPVASRLKGHASSTAGTAGPSAACGADTARRAP